MTDTRIPLSVPDSDIPVERVVSHLEPLIQRKRQKVESLFLPTMPLQVSARAYKLFPAGVFALSVIGLHYQLAQRKPFALRQDVLDAYGISPRTWRRYVGELEAGGFVSIRHRPGHRPELTLTDAAYISWFNS